MRNNKSPKSDVCPLAQKVRKVYKKKTKKTNETKINNVRTYLPLV